MKDRVWAERQWSKVSATQYWNPEICHGEKGSVSFNGYNNKTDEFVFCALCEADLKEFIRIVIN